MTSLVLTLLGPDRPGLVESVADVIAGNGGNWLESRMAHLAGKFAGVLRADVPADKVDTVIQALRKLESRGLKIRFIPIPMVIPKRLSMWLASP